MTTTTTQTTRRLGDLHLADYNPRKIRPDELKKLQSSIAEFGFVEPVVVRAEDGLLIGGHQRLAAYRQLLKEELREDIEETLVPVALVAGLDELRTKALNIALNRIGGEWDYEKLTDVLKELAEGNFDTTLSGFSANEVEDFFTLASSGNPDDLDALARGGDAGGDDGAALLGAAGEMKRSFSFKLATDDEATEVKATLETFGMTGPKSAPEAFLAIVRAARKVGPPVVEPKPPKKPKAAKKTKAPATPKPAAKKTPRKKAA